MPKINFKLSDEEKFSIMKVYMELMKTETILGFNPELYDKV